ncbi:MAG: glycosyltransferase family 2 protein [Pirellulales bacterium]
MLHGKRIVVVLPAYRAQHTLRRTYAAMPSDVVDEVLLVDDCSDDQTVWVARELGIKSAAHARNLGYGANQKTCYELAISAGADVVVMLHPDYQYDPRLVAALAALVASDVYDVALGSRMLGRTALRGGMPLYKYVANRILTRVQNLCLGVRLSEFHTGYRAFSRRVIETLPLGANSDDFVFDNQILTQAIAFGFSIGEISCPTKYFAHASTIDFRRSLRYGLAVLATTGAFLLWKWGLRSSPLFERNPRYCLAAAHGASRRLAPETAPSRTA